MRGGSSSNINLNHASSRVGHENPKRSNQHMRRHALPKSGTPHVQQTRHAETQTELENEHRRKTSGARTTDAWRPRPNLNHMRSRLNFQIQTVSEKRLCVKNTVHQRHVRLYLVRNHIGNLTNQPTCLCLIAHTHRGHAQRLRNDLSRLQCRGKHQNVV